MTHTEAHPHHRPRPLLLPLGPRPRDEAHRVATPLELFFDLVIVVAVARAAQQLHHSLGHGDIAQAVIGYSMMFFGVWWAWINFTWFASAYDNDDVAYRLLVLLQLTGALIFAAGIPDFAHGHLTIGITGYVVMRLALVALWLRAARADKLRRRTALRYALGIVLVQCAWVGVLFLPFGLGVAGFWSLALLEMLVPAWSERAEPTNWHPHHIAERYSLLTLITLGEAVLAASNALESAASSRADLVRLLPIILGGLLTLYSCWWLYFEQEAHEILKDARSAFLWGYGHYFLFGAAAALGAGISVALDAALERNHLSHSLAGATVAVPAAIYLAALWLLHVRSHRTWEARLLAPAVVVGILLTPLLPEPVLATGLLLAVLTAVKVVRAARVTHAIAH